MFEPGNGLRAIANGATGNAIVNYTGDSIRLNGGGSTIVASANSGSSTVTAQGELYSATTPASGNTGHGIAAITTQGPSVSATFTGPLIEVIGPDNSTRSFAAIYGSAIGSNQLDTTMGGSGIATINNTGSLIAHGKYGSGIWSVTNSGAQSITNSGEINTLGDDGHGIYALTNTSAITINNSESVTSALGSGVFVSAAGNSAKLTLTNDAAGNISGAIGVGVSGGFATAQINNAGTIGSSTDFAVNASAQTVGTLTIGNTGTITGYMMLGAGTNTLNNSGVWNLRNFTDTDGNGARDTLATAVSDFGTSGANVANNTGTIALLGDSSLPTVLAQGEINGVATFDNSGTIDLRADNKAGNQLVISGGATFGTFIANGGTLLIDTVLNEGGASSLSDVLVVDSTQLGSGAVAIDVRNAGGLGALTTGDGILVVRVMDAMASPDGVFTAAPIIVNGFEYRLYKGGVNGSNPQNWYLRTLSRSPRDFSTASIPALNPAMLVFLALAVAGAALRQRRK